MADYVKRKIVEKLARSITLLLYFVRSYFIYRSLNYLTIQHRFTKDLKPSDISLNFLTGKGTLLNLELNAQFITEVLQLPPWIQISRVVCDKIRGRVPFTSLSSEPVTFVRTH